MGRLQEVCAVLVLLIGQLSTTSCRAFSNDRKDSPSKKGTISPSTSLPAISRRDYWKVSLGVVGGVAYGKLVGDALSRVGRGIQYPDAHEQRVSATISNALHASASTLPRNLERPFRILEVGIGSDWRVLRRGLYDSGLSNLASQQHISSVDLTGVDLTLPSKRALSEAKGEPNHLMSSDSMMSLEIDAMAGDITDRLAYPDNCFDCVICCLTLCSVQEQQLALNEMKRLVRPNGGTFGYVEHVAVNPDEPYRFLEWQQTALDPLQQALADNCHLHRYTEDSISSTFDVPNSAQRINRERFLVNDMWPVSCQCCGVIQRGAQR